MRYSHEIRHSVVDELEWRVVSAAGVELHAAALPDIIRSEQAAEDRQDALLMHEMLRRRTERPRRRP